MEHSYNFSNSKDHQLYLQVSSPPGISIRLGPIIQPIPHRTPVALFWDLFRGLHLTSWRWMACRRSNYPHDLLGVSETLQPDYPRIPPDHGWSTFSAMTHSLQLSSTLWTVDLHSFKNRRGTSLSRIWSPQSFEGLWVNQCSVQLCSVMGYQHLAKLCRLMGCSATLLKPHWILT